MAAKCSLLREILICLLIILCCCTIHGTVRLFWTNHDVWYTKSFKYGMETMLEIPIVILSLTAYTTIYKLTSTSSFNSSIQRYRFCVENFFLVFPALLSFTMLSENLLGLILFHIAVILCVLHVASSHNMRLSWNSDDKAVERSIVMLKSSIQVCTVIAILGVDFNIFPHRFAKSRYYGITMMNVGLVMCSVMRWPLVRPVYLLGSTFILWSRTWRIPYSPLLLALISFSHTTSCQLDVVFCSGAVADTFTLSSCRCQPWVCTRWLFRRITSAHICGVDLKTTSGIFARKPRRIHPI